MQLCGILNILFESYRRRDNYQRGWGHECMGAKPIVSSWTLCLQDLHNHPVELAFDLFDEESPFAVEMDIRRYSITEYVTKPATLTIKLPTDTGSKVMQLYVSEKPKYDARARVVIVPAIGELMPITFAETIPKTVAKWLNRLTHAPKNEILEICRRAWHMSQDLERQIRQRASNCVICAGSGPQLPSRKISISQVNQAFNVEIQVDFMFCTERYSSKWDQGVHESESGGRDWRCIEPPRAQSFSYQSNCTGTLHTSMWRATGLDSKQKTA